MKGIPAIYLGKIVQKENFRAFIYGPNGKKKLVESWDAFEACMQSGIWFASIEDADANTSIVDEIEECKEEFKPKSKPKSKSKAIKGEDRMVFEVTDES